MQIIIKLILRRNVQNNHNNLFLNVKKRYLLKLKTFTTNADCLNLKDIKTMKVLNVAEKNDAAKNIAGYISKGTSRRREGLSKFNKIYEFNARVWNQNCQMIMTSVSGHLLGFDFAGAYRKWHGCPPLSLFEAPVVKSCTDQNYEKIKKTIEKEVKSCNVLIIWTDCDREGENIGFEIIQVCQAVKPNITVYRAKFSEITQASIDRALQNLEAPNKALSDAVDVRSELDLRIGAAFTRFQTLRLQKVFPTSLADLLISYGPCQFPTLGFVVERFLAIERFEPEPYWKLKVTHTQDDLTVEFRWARNRLFEKLPCEIFLDVCQENPQATVEKIISKPKSKWRPLPLDTIELEKQGSRKLRLSAKETMKAAERLYTQGFISYPRTETNIFPKDMNLTSLVTHQTDNTAGWGNFARSLLEQGINPRVGKKSDQAHPPIHPLKYTNNLQGNEKQVYEFVVRHFLACLSKNAEGYETIVEIDIAGEKFVTNGLQIIARNYLEVYIYEKWNAKEIHIYEQGQTFIPTTIQMVEETTSPPNLLTEADLIALMDKHGIGTDATHAEHIETIKSRQYVGLKDQKYLIPGKLGIGLVMGYDRMGFEMSKPHLRAELENDLKLICESQKQPDEVRQRMIGKYREVFREALTKANMIDEALAEYLDEQPIQSEHREIADPVEEPVVLKCPRCNSNMTVRTRRQGSGKFIGCMNYPTCNNVIWFNDAVEDIQVLNERCNECPDNILRKIKVKLKRNAFHMFGTDYTTCIGGCDDSFNDMMEIRLQTVRRNRDLPANLRTPNQPATNSGSLVRPSSSNLRPPHNSATGVQASANSNQRSVISNQSNRSSSTQQSNEGSNWSAGSTNLNSSSNTSQWNDNWTPGSSSNQSTNASRQSQSNQQNNSSWGNSTLTDWSNNENNEIMCNCNLAAKQLTVRKEGPNQGRLFYKCAKPQNEACSFFLWDPESSSAPASQRPGPNNWNQNQGGNNASMASHGTQNNQNLNVSGNWDDWNNDSGQINCTCGQPARKLTVHKEGPNKGRMFYGCPQGPGSSCNFFKWADENNPNSHNTSWGGPPPPPGPGRGRGRGRGAGGASKPRGAPGGTKRKCGNCGTEGHTKRTCPENSAGW